MVFRHMSALGFLLVSCIVDTEHPSSDAKHQLIIEGDHALKKYAHEFLINHIFRDVWDVAYYVQPACWFSNDHNRLAEIETAIKDTMKRWLVPLGGAGAKFDNQQIVNKFNLTNVSDEYKIGALQSKYDPQVAKRKKEPKSVEEFRQVLLTVFFYCGAISPSSGGTDGAHHDLDYFDEYVAHNTIHIHLPFSGSQPDSTSYGCDEVGDTGINRFTLLHEMGHAMGLDDTYDLAGGFYDERRIMDIHNPGQYQPPSIMACSYEYDDDRDHFVPDSNQAPRLYPDDIAGIHAAYSKIVKGEEKE